MTETSTTNANMTTSPFARMMEFSRAAEAACGYMPPVADIALAVHEASHAVIGRVLGFECGEARIHEDGTGGVAHVGDRWVHEGRTYEAGERVEQSILVSYLEAKIMVGLSGIIGEPAVLGWSKRHERDNGYRGDEEAIETLRKLLRWPGGWKAARQRLEDRAQDLIDKHRDAIRRVTLALLKHRTLDGSAIDALLLVEADNG